MLIHSYFTSPVSMKRLELIYKVDNGRLNVKVLLLLLSLVMLVSDSILKFLELVFMLLISLVLHELLKKISPQTGPT